MKTMTTGLCALWLSLSLVGPLQGQARPPRDLVLGKDVRFELAPPALSGSSTRISGELLSVTDDSLTVLVDSGLRTVPLAQIRSLELARHRFGWRKVLTWTAIGAGVT
ncbi:MAG TPA: hypothetical protein VLL48_07560, partial [Longimicrobiales bacterium]|nr:hypothetical protein [Longimicrobiales bacterium]